MLLAFASGIYFFTEGNYARVCFQNEDFFLRNGGCFEKVSDFGKQCSANSDCENVCYVGATLEDIQTDDEGFIVGSCASPRLEESKDVRGAQDTCTFPESLNIKTPLADFDTTCL